MTAPTTTRPPQGGIVVVAPDRCTKYRVPAPQPTPDEIADWCHPRHTRQQADARARELGLV